MINTSKSLAFTSSITLSPLTGYECLPVYEVLAFGAIVNVVAPSSRKRNRG